MWIDNKEYAFRCAYIRELWRRLGREYPRVAIYGAGKHTRWLLDFMRPLPAQPKVVAILDDRPVVAQMDQVPIRKTETLAPGECDAIFISSDANEAVLAARARALFGQQFPIIAPYAEIGPGPFLVGSSLTGAAMVEHRQARVDRLAGFRNLYAGRRAFIVCNGPSLNRMDLSRLKSEVTFGMNRIYLMFDRLGFSTTTLTAINRLVVMQFAADIKRLPMPKFLPEELAALFVGDPQAYFIKTVGGPPGFSLAPDEVVWEGNTVTYAVLQLAFFMGVQQAILIGADHHYQSAGNPNQPVVAQSSDVNHFAPDYFPPGVTWQLPDLAASEQAYAVARQQYEAAGREILDATVDGHLHVFPKVDYARLF